MLKIEVQRNSGARGKIIVPYKTINGTARGGGIDYVDAVGELEFDNDETSLVNLLIHIQQSSYIVSKKIKMVVITTL